MAYGHWEHFPHQADIGIRGLGRSPAEAFEQAALALIAVVSDPAAVRAQTAVAVTCEAPDLELLLVDWLNALILEMAVRHMLFCQFSVAIDDARLAATAWGEPIDPGRHPLAVEAKGATYTELRVWQQAPDRWCAQCVVDV